MGLHRLTPVMTSAQRHNKANSRLLQVQLLGLPGGEQKTPKKHRHVVGGGQQGATRAAPGRQTCKSAAAQPHPCCSVPWGRGQRGLWGGTSTEGWGRRGTTPCASAPSSVSIQHKNQAKRAARSAEALSASASVVQGPCLAESLPAHPASHQSILELAPGTLQEGSSGDQKAPRALLQKLFYSDLLPAPAKPQIFLQRGRGLLLRRCHLQVGREEPCMQQGSSSPSSTPQPAALGRATKNCAFKVPSAQG